MEYKEVDEVFIREMDMYRQPPKGKGLIEACSEDIVLFTQYMLGMRLYAWQVYFLRRIQRAFEGKTDQREFVALTSRQVGKSIALAVLCIWAAIFNKYPGTLMNNTQIGIASASDAQAKKLLYEMKKLIRLGDATMKIEYNDTGKMDCGKEFFSNLLDDHEPNNTTTITLKPHNDSHGEYLLKGSKAGSVIKSYPPTSIVLGETFSIVIIDEAGKTEKITDQFFYDYMYPTGNSTDAIRIYTSTPWVSSGFFYRMVDPDGIYGSSPADVTVFTIDAIRLENEKYYNTVKRTVEQMEQDGKQDEVQRAYYCRFVKGQKAYFDPNDVFACFDENTEQVDGYTGLCDMGVDFGGQTTSRTVITITALDPDDIVRRKYVKCYEVGEDNTIIEDIEQLKGTFNVQRMIPDDCPQGDYIIRQMVDKGWDVHPMNFRTDKVKKYGAFRSALHRHEIKSFMDEELRTEMLALEVSDGRKNSVIEHAPGYSDDKIDSFLLSCYFLVQDEGGFKAFGPKDSALEEHGSTECVCGSTSLFMSEDKKNVYWNCMNCGRKWKANI